MSLDLFYMPNFKPSFKTSSIYEFSIGLYA